MAEGSTAQIYLTERRTRSRAFQPAVRQVQQYQVMRPHFTFGMGGHPTQPQTMSHEFGQPMPDAYTPQVLYARHDVPFSALTTTGFTQPHGPLQNHKPAQQPLQLPQNNEMPQGTPNWRNGVFQRPPVAQFDMRQQFSQQPSPNPSVAAKEDVKFDMRTAQPVNGERVQKNPEVMRFDTQALRKVPDTKTTTLASKESKSDKFPGDLKCGIAVLDGQLYVRGPVADLARLKQNLMKMSCFQDATFIEDEPNSGRIIAIDFDKTIAQTFLWAELGGLDGDEAQLRTLHQWARTGRLREAFGTQERLDMFRSVLQVCKERGDLVCILSSGYAKVIVPALAYMGFSDIFNEKNVYGSDTWPRGISKSNRLTHLKRHYGRAQATLVDDDIGYCRGCLRDGHDVIWVKLGQGMQQVEMDKLLNGTWDQGDYLKF